MTTENVCPFCGGPLENITDNKCPSCGSAIPTSASSSATIISPRSSFNSSAEVMDEVKRLSREGDSSRAAEVLGTEFGMDQAAAKQTADQVEFELQHDGRETSNANAGYPNSYTNPEVIDAPLYENVQKPANNRNMIIGGSIGAAVFLCCCCCLPIIAMLMRMRSR